MRLLFISSFYPFRETRFGGSKRLYYLAKEWSRNAQLSLISMDGCAEWPGGDRNRHPEFGDFLMVPGGKAKSWRERYLSAHEDLRPVVEASRDRIRSFMSGRSFDAVLLAYPATLPFLDGYLQGINAPVTYLEDDLSFERYRAEAAISHRPLAKAGGNYRRWQALSFYRPRLTRVSKFVGISREEIDIMERQFPALRGFMASYGLPLEEYPILPLPSGRPTLGFIGNFGHPPNVVGLRWLADGLASAIRSRCSGVRFVLAGKGIPVWAHEAFRGQSDVEFLEDVPVLEEFYREISVFINPIRTGRGMRTKVVEAAAFGRPIVTTSLGAEGIQDLEMRVADGTERLAEACGELIHNPDLLDITRRNRSVVELRYNLGKVAGDLLDFLRTP